MPAPARSGLLLAIGLLCCGHVAGAHLTVYASQKANVSPAQAYLYVHVNALPVDGGARHAIAVQPQLRQTLESLVTGSRIVDAMTWDAHDVLVTETSTVSDLRAELR